MVCIGLRYIFVFFFSSRRRHTRFSRDWSSDVCSSDLVRNHPALAETNRTSDDDFIFVEHAAYTERVLCFILRAIGNFVVERAKTLCPMSVRAGTHVCSQIGRASCRERL